MYKTPEPGFCAASKMTEERIGPVHGVQPAANAIPIRIDPIKPEGRCLNSMRRSIIINPGLKIPTIINPKNTINIPPSCRIKSLYSRKKLPMKDVPNPMAIKIMEKPNRKNKVCRRLRFWSIALSLFNSATDIPVI